MSEGVRWLLCWLGGWGKGGRGEMGVLDWGNREQEADCNL